MQHLENIFLSKCSTIMGYFIFLFFSILQKFFNKHILISKPKNTI